MRRLAIVISFTLSVIACSKKATDTTGPGNGNNAKGFCLTIGDSTGKNEEAFSIIQTKDGGYAVAGYTDAFGEGHDDVYLIKFDSLFNIQWTKTTGGSGYDYSYSIIQTSDGGYAVAGSTSSFGTSLDVYVIKLDASGTIQWTKVIGGNYGDEAKSIIQTSDGGYAVVGETNSFGSYDIYLIKLDGNGNVQWTKTINKGAFSYGESIIQTNDGGYAIAAYTDSFNVSEDIYIIKLDASGNLKWAKQIGGPHIDIAYSIIQTTDGGYAVAGWTDSFIADSINGGYVYVIKLDGNGNIQWNKIIGTDGTASQGKSIIQTTDGGYAIGGFISTLGSGKYHAYVVKLSSNGDLQWTKVIGDTAENYFYSLIQTKDGGYVGAGYSGDLIYGGVDVFIAKLDANGNPCPACSIGSTGQILTPNPNVSSPTTNVSTVNSSVAIGGTEHSGGIIRNLCSSSTMSRAKFDKTSLLCYELNSRFGRMVYGYQFKL